MDNTNLNVISGSKLEEFGTQIWDAMKVYLASNVDTSALMGVVKQYLDSANREVIGTTGTEKAQAIDTSIAAMVAAFEDAGVSMTGKTAADFAEIIGQLTNVSGVYLLDENNVQWTAEHWAEEKRGGAVMPNLIGVLLVMANQEVIMSLDEETKAWGTYGVALQNLDTYTGGPVGTPKSGYNNTSIILAECDPDELISSGRAIVYQSGVTTVQQITNAYCVMFADSASQVSFAQSYGLAQMNSWGYTKVYAYGSTGHWRTSYWKQNQTTINANSFQQMYASAPASDSYGYVGSPSTKWCNSYKAYTGDTKQWYEGSIVELFSIFLNLSSVNACLAADNRTLITIASNVYYWSSIPNLSYGAWFIEFLSGGISGNGHTKYSQYKVRAFTTR